MARKGKTTSRLELRKAAEAAERLSEEEEAEDDVESDDDSAELGGDADVDVGIAELSEDEEEKPVVKTVKKKPAKKAVRRKSSKKKVDAQRLRLVWGVFDNSNQQIATFPYPDRAAAEQKATEMREKGRGPYFVQPVKEPMPIEAAPEEA